MECELEVERRPNVADIGEYRLLVLNDPVNLMSYVQWVFESYFGYESSEAHALMMRVHNHGSAIVARGGREDMERDAKAMIGYGLRAQIRGEQ